MAPANRGPETDSSETEVRERDSPDIQPIVRPRGWTAQYTSDYDIFGKFGKEICETGVALHPRLQDRASFGDYCRGATPG